MCFSAPVSFTAAAILTTTSAILLRRLKHKKHLALALIPLFFGLQQFAEGLVWINVIPTFAIITYLFFAFVFWPIYIPFSFWFAEKNKATLVLLALGLGIAAYLAMNVFSSQARFVHHSIQYGAPEKKDFIPFLLYLCATTIPFFLSRIPQMKMLGIVAAISGLFIAYIYTTLFVSLWCFFAAIVSFGLLLTLPKKV